MRGQTFTSPRTGASPRQVGPAAPTFVYDEWKQSLMPEEELGSSVVWMKAGK